MKKPPIQTELYKGFFRGEYIYNIICQLFVNDFKFFRVDN